MTTRRRINRSSQQRFAPATLDAFDQMHRVEWKGDEWWRLHYVIASSGDVKVPLWSPCIVERPDDEPVIDRTTSAADWNYAVSVYRDLEGACAARRQRWNQT